MPTCDSCGNDYDTTFTITKQLDRHKILDPAGIEAYRKAAPDKMPAFLDLSAEVLLLGALQRRMEELDGEA